MLVEFTQNIANIDSGAMFIFLSNTDDLIPDSKITYIYIKLCSLVMVKLRKETKFGLHAVNAVMMRQSGRKGFGGARSFLIKQYMSFFLVYVTCKHKIDFY